MDVRHVVQLPECFKRLSPCLQVDKTMPIPKFLAETAALIKPVDAFFDKVLEKTDNERV